MTLISLFRPHKLRHGDRISWTWIAAEQNGHRIKSIPPHHYPLFTALSPFLSFDIQ